MQGAAALIWLVNSPQKQLNGRPCLPAPGPTDRPTARRHALGLALSGRKHKHIWRIINSLDSSTQRVQMRRFQYWKEEVNALMCTCSDEEEEGMKREERGEAAEEVQSDIKSSSFLYLVMCFLCKHWSSDVQPLAPPTGLPFNRFCSCTDSRFRN